MNNKNEKEAPISHSKSISVVINISQVLKNMQIRLPSSSWHLESSCCARFWANAEKMLCIWVLVCNCLIIPCLNLNDWHSVNHWAAVQNEGTGAWLAHSRDTGTHACSVIAMYVSTCKKIPWLRTFLKLDEWETLSDSSCFCYQVAISFQYSQEIKCMGVAALFIFDGSVSGHVPF